MNPRFVDSGPGVVVLDGPDWVMRLQKDRPSPEDVKAAAGVDTHPGGEELKHYWVYGEGAAKWSTWTELEHHLLQYLNEGMAKRTAAAWFHLRYGYWPGDKRNVHAKFNPAEPRNLNGEWSGGGSKVSALAGRIGSDDGLDLEVLSAADGTTTVRFPFPDDSGAQADRVVLAPAGAAQLKSGIADAGTAGKAHLAKLRKVSRDADAAEGTPGHAGAVEEFWKVADQPVVSGSVQGSGGTSLHWEVAAGEDDVTLSLAVKPADAGPGWNFHEEVSDGAGGNFPLTAAAKLGKLLDKAASTRVTSAAAEADAEAEEWEALILALVTALAELSGSVQAAFDEAKHPRGSGGKFRSTVDKLKDAIQTHRSGGGKGDPFEGFDREQLRRAAKTRGITLSRGEDRDSIAKKLLGDLGEEKPAGPEKVEPPAKRAPAKRAPAKKAPAKRAPAKKTGSPNRSSGTDLIGSDPEALARRVAKDREHHVAADRSLSVIGHEQGFDGKPRVVSKADMDRLVAGGGTEIFRGVKALDDGKTAAEIHQDMREGHAWYGLGIYGNGYYWGGPDHAAKFADKSEGSTARAVLDPDAKVIEFWGELYPEHEKFMEQHKGAPDETHINEVYSDPGRYAAARGYDVIKIVPNKGEPWYNVLNRTALVVEEA